MAWAGRHAFTALLILAPVSAFAGDGSFGVPASGILMPPPPAPARTASLVPPAHADVEKARPILRAQQTYQPAPAEGAGRSRALPPSETPVHAPIVVPPKKKQFKAPVATVDPVFVASLEEGTRDDDLAPTAITAPVPESTPVMAQGAAPETKRGLFTSPSFRNRSAPVYSSAAAAAYDEHSARAPMQQAQPVQQVSAPQRGPSQANARVARNGTPCSQLRGIFTSPPECR